MLIKVLGIGSPFGEDQAGWQVVELLKQDFPDSLKHVEIAYFDRPGVRLLELMRDTDIVYLIDAVKTGMTVGTIHRLHNEDILDFKNIVSTHDIGVAQALQLGHALNVLPKHIVLYGIEINHAEFNTVISSAVEQAIQHAVMKLKDELLDIKDNEYRLS